MMTALWAFFPQIKDFVVDISSWKKLIFFTERDLMCILCVLYVDEAVRIIYSTFYT